MCMGNKKLETVNLNLCKKCKSSHIVGHGSVTTVKKGKLARFKCQDCGSTFYKDGE
jgi:transposase-like protein